MHDIAAEKVYAKITAFFYLIQYIATAIGTIDARMKMLGVPDFFIAFSIKLVILSHMLLCVQSFCAR